MGQEAAGLNSSGNLDRLVDALLCLSSPREKERERETESCVVERRAWPCPRWGCPAAPNPARPLLGVGQGALCTGGRKGEPEGSQTKDDKTGSQSAGPASPPSRHG